MKKSNNFKGYFNLDTIIFICFFELFFSGERQLLLTLWGGKGHNIAYASKAHIELQKSGLCIGGFTQPDRMMEIIEEMKASSDGLFDRFLFWLLPGYIYNGKYLPSNIYLKVGLFTLNTSLATLSQVSVDC